jgi:hypothetical protein
MNFLCKDTNKILCILDKYNINTTDLLNITKNKYFMKLYNDIKKNFKRINKNNYMLKIKIIDKNPLNYLEDNKFTSDNIKNKILKKLKYGYQFNFNNNEIIYYSKKNIKNTVPNIIIHMFQIIVTLKKIFNKNNYKQTIIYFETDEKKKFPKKNIILGPNEVNSGLTFLDLDLNKLKNGNIILYRKEEILKVLIHELIHSNLIDEKIIFSKKTNEFSNLFCVDYKILLNEAFTESLATVINIFYIHIFYKIKKNRLNLMFKNEIKYSNYICSKIIKFYGINNIKDILKNNNECINNFPQKTNVFSYYILKNILLTNHILFSNILDKYTLNYKINNENCIIDIINLILNNINSININDIFIKDNNKSLRLCLYELDNK